MVVDPSMTLDELKILASGKSKNKTNNSLESYILTPEEIKNDEENNNYITESKSNLEDTIYNSSTTSSGNKIYSSKSEPLFLTSTKVVRRKSIRGSRFSSSDTTEIEEKPEIESSKPKLTPQQVHMRKNIEAVVRDISQQFTEPEDSYRELGQNSIDSKTKQLNVFSQVEKIDEKFSYLTLTFKDFGIGMTTNQRDDFFLKLFKSSKENDPTTIGKYGIGISSIFALDLEEILVSSQSEDLEKQGWAMHIKGISNAPSYRFIDQNQDTQGTTISLVRKVKNDELETHTKKIKSKISFYCERSRIPIIINGENITKAFELETDVSVSKATQSLEFVLGFNKKSKYEFFNNRLKLEEGTDIDLFGRQWKGLSLLASSHKLQHTFSRDGIIRNDEYREIIEQIKTTIPQLFLKSLEIYQAHIDENKDSENKALQLKIPTLELQTKTGVTQQFTYEFTLRQLEYNVKSNTSANYYKESKDVILEKIQAHKKIMEEFENDIEKRKNEQIQKAKNFYDAKGFIQLYLENMRNKSRSDLESSTTKKILSKLKISQTNDLEELKKNLPKGTEDFKIIPTHSGEYISIIELINEINEHGEILYLRPEENNKKLEQLLENTGRTIFDGDSTQYSYFANPNQPTYGHQKVYDNRYGLSGHVLVGSRIDENIMPFVESMERAEKDHLGYKKYKIKTIFAGDVYTESIKIEDELESYHTQFLEDIKKQIKKIKLNGYGETYFTQNSEKRKFVEATFTKSQDGRIDITSGSSEHKKPGIFKRAYNYAAGVEFDNPKKDIVINLSNPKIQSALDLYSYGDELSKQTAVNRVLTNMETNVYFYTPISIFDLFNNSNYYNNTKQTKRQSFLETRKGGWFSK